jgi:GAF domain-containing protein
MSLIDDAINAKCDPLDDHVEAQVHGPVRLADDVEALVLDPCYRGTDVEALARQLPCSVEWHPGFILSVDTLQQHPTFRGQEYVDLGMTIARNGLLTPSIIGDAARTGKYEVQDLKKVWHYLARFGDRSDEVLHTV